MWDVVREAGGVYTAFDGTNRTYNQADPLIETFMAAAKIAALGADWSRAIELLEELYAENPAYRDVMYIEQLIGNETVNTLPLASLDAFRDHGEAKKTLPVDVAVVAAVAVGGAEGLGPSVGELAAGIQHQAGLDHTVAAVEDVREAVANHLDPGRSS